MYVVVVLSSYWITSLSMGYSKENLKIHTGIPPTLPSLPYPPLPFYPSPCLPLPSYIPLPLEVGPLKSS